MLSSLVKNNKVETTQLLKIKKIKNFNALDILKYPYDIDWLWNDNYINNIFDDCV